MVGSGKAGYLFDEANDPVIVASEDTGKTLNVVAGSDDQTIAGIKIRGELFEGSAADTQRSWRGGVY